MPTTNPLIIKYQESVKIFEEDVLPIIVVRSNGVKSATHLIGLTKSFLLTRFLASWEETVKRGEDMKQRPPQPVHGMGGDMTMLFERLNAHNSALTSFLEPYYESIKWAKGELLNNK